MADANATANGGFFSRLSAGGMVVATVVGMILFGVVGAAVNYGVQMAQVSVTRVQNQLEAEELNLLERRKEIEAKYPPRAPVLTPVQHKSTILNTSPCPDLETREAVLGDQANLRDVDQGQSYQLLPGCALIRVNTTISRFSGSGYLFQEEVGTGAGKYWECGSITGNGPDECRSYLNARHGKVIRLIIQNGAGVFIN